MPASSFLAARTTLLAATKLLRPDAFAAPGQMLLPSPALAETLGIWTLADAVAARSPADLRRWQMLHLDGLFAHASAHSAFWRQRLAGWAGDLADLPVLRRADLRQQVTAEGALPSLPGHGQVATRSTSGSTGTALSLFATHWAGMFAQFLYEKHVLESGMDISAPLLSIFPRNTASVRPNWGGALGQLFATGPMIAMSANTDLAEIIALIRQHPGAVLATGTPIVAALVDAWPTAAPDHAKPLAWIMARGSNFDEALRARTRQVLGAQVLDRYSCEEIGPIALECPHHPFHYHVASANAVVEVLRLDGTLAAPGEVGRVVVSGLHSHATPFIRYELGDLAALHLTCACGFQGPTLTDIAGRTGEIIRLPDGKILWAQLRVRDLLAILPVHEFRLTRRQPTAFDLELVLPDGTLTEVQHQALVALVREKTIQNADVTITISDTIDWGNTYKRREFVDLVATNPG